MISRIRKLLDEREAGFTLIELLVVIIIIGILAAIAIPTFLNQRKKGWDAASKATLRNYATAEESYYTDKNTYTYDTTALKNQGFNNDATTTPITTYGTADTSHYCVSAKTGNGNTYYISADTGQPSTTACT